MDSKAVFLASKTLLDFIRDFTRLNEELLVDVRRLMQSTVSEVMDLMMNLSSVPQESVSHAGKVPNQAKAIQNVANHFSKEVEAVCLANERVGQLVSSLMGAVSTDDVIKQRLDHIVFAVERLNLAMRDIIHNHQGKLTSESVDASRNRILTDIYLAYTTEDERHIFHRIFGKPKKAAKAA